MKRRLVLTVAVALIGAGLFTAAQALRGHFGRRTVVARGWWSLGAPTVPGEQRDQRWQMVFTVEADGAARARRGAERWRKRRGKRARAGERTPTISHGAGFARGRSLLALSGAALAILLGSKLLYLVEEQFVPLGGPLACFNGLLAAEESFKPFA